MVYSHLISPPIELGAMQSLHRDDWAPVDAGQVVPDALGNFRVIRTES